MEPSTTHRLTRRQIEQLAGEALEADGVDTYFYGIRSGELHSQPDPYLAKLLADWLEFWSVRTVTKPNSEATRHLVMRGLTPGTAPDCVYPEVNRPDFDEARWNPATWPLSDRWRERRQWRERNPSKWPLPWAWQEQRQWQEHPHSHLEVLPIL